MFFSSVSHEIRTPLLGIVGCVELLSQSGLKVGQDEYVDTILLCSNKLLKLVGDILELSRLETTPLERLSSLLNLRPFNLVERMHDVVKMFGDQAVEKGLRLNLDAKVLHNGQPAAKSVLVVADELRIRQILVNLIANSVVYTSRGRVDVTLQI